MCPTLQETKPDSVECVGAIGGYQYGRQLYLNRPYDIVSVKSESTTIYNPEIWINDKRVDSLKDTVCSNCAKCQNKSVTETLSVVKCRLDLGNAKADSLSAIRSRLTGNRYGFSQK
ncbi:hypothetical protein CR513_02085, partial [Mucuna pruriens]